MLAYDPSDRSLFVAYSPNHVAIAYGNGSLRTTIAVGYDPFDIAIDGGTNEAYVTNEGSANVTGISGSTLHTLASVRVQKGPAGIAFDGLDSRLFVADRDSDNVSVLSVSPFAILCNVSVGASPIGVAWDPTTDHVFVANHGSGTVSVINGSTMKLVTTIHVGNGPFELALDNATDNVYVSDELSNQVSVISASTDSLVATVAVPLGAAIDLQGLTYDARHRLIWAAGGEWYAVVINTTRQVVVDYLWIDPAGAAYDSSNGNVCLTDTANRTLACYIFGPRLTNSLTGIGTTAGMVTFVEVGLPTGTPWTIRYLPTSRAGVSTAMSETSDIRFGVFRTFDGLPFSMNFTVGSVPGYLPSNRGGYVASSSGAGITIFIRFS